MAGDLWAIHQVLEDLFLLLLELFFDQLLEDLAWKSAIFDDLILFGLLFLVSLSLRVRGSTLLFVGIDGLFDTILDSLPDLVEISVVRFFWLRFLDHFLLLNDLVLVLVSTWSWLNAELELSIETSLSFFKSSEEILVVRHVNNISSVVSVGYAVSIIFD